jgi:hypothetical protein
MVPLARDCFIVATSPFSTPMLFAWRDITWFVMLLEMPAPSKTTWGKISVATGDQTLSHRHRP